MAFGMVVPKSNPAVPAPYEPGSAVAHGSPADPAAVNAAPALPAPACPASASSHTASAISAPASAFMEAAVIAFADMIASLLIAFAVMALLAIDATIHPAALVISVEVNAPSAKCSLAKALSAIFADVIQSAARFSAAISLFPQRILSHQT